MKFIGGFHPSSISHSRKRNTQSPSTRKRYSFLAFLGTVAALLLGANAAQATHVDPIFVSGNQTCGDLIPGTTELKIEPVVDGTFPGMGGFSVTIDVMNTGSGEVFDWEAEGGIALGVFVKGGPDGNLYDYRPGGETMDDGLHAPVNNKNGRFYSLSHVSFCYTQAPEIDVTKDCTNPRLNEAEDGIIYDISGMITVDIGTLYNINLSDNPPVDGGVFQWVECGNPANVLGTFPLMSITAGTPACYLATITVGLGQNGPIDEVTVTGNTNPDGMSGIEVTDSQMAQCPTLQISPMVMVDKQCETVIDVFEGQVIAKVNISGQVCNSGDTTLTNVQVEDDKAGIVLSGVTLAPSDCQGYMGTYTPTEALDGMDNPTTDPSQVAFKDTVTASALDIFGQPVMQQTAGACCTLCPGSDQCPAENGAP